MKPFTAILALALLPMIALSEKPEEKAKPAKEAKASKVRFKTNKGDFVVELNAEKAPITVGNFLSYVNKKHYDGTAFHRIMSTFMIQGGGFTVENGMLTQKAVDKPIKNEGQNGLKNERGTIAMARTGELDSATSQFFINVVDNAMLDYPNNGGYAVFGKVVEGMDVVDKIKAVPTKMADGPRPEKSVPLEPVVIESAKVE